MKFIGLFLLVFFAWSPEALAQRACIDHHECEANEQCTFGRCEPRKSVHDTNAEDSCGDDRRCRIERLRRQNQARRVVQITQEERLAQLVLEEARAAEQRRFVRESDRIKAGLRLSRSSFLGLYAGYNFTRHLGAEFGFFYTEDWVGVFESDFNFDGFQETYFFSPALVYFLTEDVFSPYVRGGFTYGRGDVSSLRFFQSGSSSVFHALEAGAGIDFQFEFGLHLRVGVDYRYLLYNQVRFGPGIYDEFSKEGLKRWFNRDLSVDFTFLLGWAF